MRNRKNRSECDTARFRGYLQNSRCLEEILIKIELLSGSWPERFKAMSERAISHLF